MSGGHNLRIVSWVRRRLRCLPSSSSISANLITLPRYIPSRTAPPGGARFGGFAVKETAIKHGLKVVQPESLKPPGGTGGTGVISAGGNRRLRLRADTYPGRTGDTAEAMRQRALLPAAAAPGRGSGHGGFIGGRRIHRRQRTVGKDEAGLPGLYWPRRRYR